MLTTENVQLENAQNLEIVELEERLEMVQLSTLDSDADSLRCDILSAD